MPRSCHCWLNALNRRMYGGVILNKAQDALILVQPALGRPTRRWAWARANGYVPAGRKPRALGREKGTPQESWQHRMYDSRPYVSPLNTPHMRSLSVGTARAGTHTCDKMSSSVQGRRGRDAGASFCEWTEYSSTSLSVAHLRAACDREATP